MIKPEIKCPTCGAEPGKSCRALTTGRVTDVHTKRWEAFYADWKPRWIQPLSSAEETK